MIGRSALFIPASSPAMLNASTVFDADSLFFDLEDAVSVGEKDSARELLRRALDTMPERNTFIRINPVSSLYWEEDAELLLNPRVKGVVIPKAMAEDVKILEKRLNKHKRKLILVPLIESAVAVEEIAEIIKSSPAIEGFLFGAEDYCLSLGVSRTKKGDEISYARARLANAARAFGVEALDTPFTDAGDAEGLEEDARYAKSLGFTGKAAINPRQIPVINRAFSAQREEIEYAERVIAAMEKAEKEGKGVVSLDGKMIDAPIVERARKIMERVRVWE